MAPIAPGVRMTGGDTGVSVGYSVSNLLPNRGPNPPNGRDVIGEKQPQGVAFMPINWSSVIGDILFYIQPLNVRVVTVTSDIQQLRAICGQKKKVWNIIRPLLKMPYSLQTCAKISAAIWVNIHHSIVEHRRKWKSVEAARYICSLSDLMVIVTQCIC